MYDLLAEHYEEILPTSEAQVEFVLSYCAKASSGTEKAEAAAAAAGGESEETCHPRLLEVGCGTGALAAAVSERGVDVEAVDLNREMIRRARELHGSRTGGLRFREADMRELESLFSQDSFEVVSCLGNTLVHLSGPEEVRAFLESTAGLLRRGGTLILQILNYDYLLTSRREELPPVKTARLEFLRRYRYPEEGRCVVFATRIRDLETGEERADEVELYPLRKAELSRLLETAGFGPPRFFGGFDGSPCAGDSLPLIAVAER